jgi:regulator of sigma E protease
LPKARLIEVAADGAAATAKLEAGDLVLSVNGRPMTDSFTLRELIRKSDQGLPQDWLIQRRGQELSIAVSPRIVTESSEYFGTERIGRVGAIIGSYKEVVNVRYGLWEGFMRGVEKTWDLSALTVKTLARMVVGEASLKNLTGPVTVAEYSGKTAAAGLGTFVLFLGLMSVSIGVLNLLPLPMLDGGHLMYYLWELLTGRAVSEAWLDKLQRAGFVFLILLTVLALYNDLVRVLGLRSFFG